MRDADPDSTAQRDQPEEELYLAALLALIDASNLKPHWKRTLGVLARYGNWKTGANIRPSLETVAWELDKSRRAVNFDIDDLLKSGVLETDGAIGPVRSKQGIVMTARRGGKERPTPYRLNLQRLRELSRVEPDRRETGRNAGQPISEEHGRSAATQTSKCSAQTLKCSAANLEVGFNRSSGSSRSGEERAALAPQLELVPEPDPDEHYAVITAVVTKDILPRRLPDEQNLPATMTRCQELHIPCTPDVARKAVDSGLFRYYRTLRLEFGLPADPRGLYHDHQAPVAMGLPTPMPVKPQRKRRARAKGRAIDDARPRAP